MDDSIGKFEKPRCEDILITSTDNLKGFTDAITTTYPSARTRICIVHQLLNSLKFIIWKDKKAVAADLKKINEASMKQPLCIILKILKLPGIRNILTSQVMAFQLE